MKARSSPGVCLIAALAAGCTFDASQLRALPDGAVEQPVLPDAGAPGSGGNTANPPDAPTAAGGNGGVTTSPPDAPTTAGGNGGITTSPPDASAAAGGSGGGGFAAVGGTGGSGGQTSMGGAAGQTTPATSIAPVGCISGASVPCACTNGQQGAQTCTSAGTFAACVCLAPTMDAGSAGGRDGAATEPPDAPTATGGSGGSSAVRSGGSTSAGGTTPVGGSPGGPPSGTTVTFLNGKAVGAMTGYGWVDLGSADSVSDPTCGPNKAAMTKAAPCAVANWSSTTALCISGSIPALPATPTQTDYNNNLGVVVGANATDPAGAGLGQAFASITITTTGSPSSGVRAQIHRLGDPEAMSYCAALTPGTAIPLTKFASDCYNTNPTGVFAAADIPKIDKVSVEVFSASTAITVTNLCITGITFVK